MLDHLKAVLHNFLDKTLATELHNEIVDLSNRVSILELEVLGVKNTPAAAPGPGAPSATEATVAVVAAKPVVEEHAAEVSEHEAVSTPEPEHGKEVQETEAHS